MTKLTIKNPQWSGEDAIATSLGTEIYLDGQRINRVLSLDLRLDTSHVVTAEIHVLALPDEEIELPADVTVVVHRLDDEADEAT